MFIGFNGSHFKSDSHLSDPQKRYDRDLEKAKRQSWNAPAAVPCRRWKLTAVMNVKFMPERITLVQFYGSRSFVVHAKHARIHIMRFCRAGSVLFLSSLTLSSQLYSASSTQMETRKSALPPGSSISPEPPFANSSNVFPRKTGLSSRLLSLKNRGILVRTSPSRFLLLRQSWKSFWAIFFSWIKLPFSRVTFLRKADGPLSPIDYVLSEYSASNNRYIPSGTKVFYHEDDLIGGGILNKVEKEKVAIWKFGIISPSSTEANLPNPDMHRRKKSLHPF